MDQILSYEDPLYIQPKDVTITEYEAIDALREAWKLLFEQYPTNKCLALITAHTMLETGRFKSCKNYNFGNLKRKPEQKFTMFATGENIWNQKLKKSEWHWFEPPHYQTAFRSYDSIVDGAKDYILFLSDRKSSEAWRNEAYKKAFDFLTKGMPKEYSLALYEAKYYTANPETYTAGIVRIFNEFLIKVNMKYGEKPLFLQNSIFDEVKIENEKVQLPIENKVIEPIVVQKQSENIIKNKENAQPKPSLVKHKADSFAGFSVIIAAIITGLYSILKFLF